MPKASPSASSWDPALLVSQIVSIQSLHYLTLSLLIPPLLTIFAQPEPLNYEGGAASVGMVMDWREMATRPTVRGIAGETPWSSFSGVWSGGKKLGGSTITWWTSGSDRDSAQAGWDGRLDPVRGWVIAFCWMVACAADIFYLYTIVRKPRMILDFSLTLVLVHFILTTYYSSSLPSSLFFWFVMFAGATMTLVITEQLCVRREMREGLAVEPQGADSRRLLDGNDAESSANRGDVELGDIRRD